MQMHRSLTDEQIEDHIRQTVLHRGPAWFANARANAPLVGQDITMLTPHPDKKTAILCASGASLMKHIDWIKAAAGSAHVWSSPTNWSYLRAHDITPDFLLSVDPSDIQREVIGEPPMSSLPTALLASPFTAHRLVSDWKGRRYWFRTFIQGKSKEEWFDDQTGINKVLHWMFPDIHTMSLQVGNVTNSMLLLSHFLAEQGIYPYERFVLVGLDLDRSRLPRYQMQPNGLWAEDTSVANLAHPAPGFELNFGSRKVSTDQVNLYYASTFYNIYVLLLDRFHICRPPGEAEGLLWGLPNVEDVLATTARRKEVGRQWHQMVSEQAP